MDCSAQSSPEAPCVVKNWALPSRNWMPRFNKMIVHEENMRVEKEERVPVRFSALPTLIQNRLPQLPSIRKTVTMPMRSSIMHMPFSSCSGASTPLSEADTEVLSVGSNEGALVESIDYSGARNFITTLGRRTPELEANKDQSGVQWRYAKQGLDLVINSGRECSQSPQSDYDPSFERHSYVTGLGYLLDALPRDLDEGEISLLQRAMPPPLAGAPPGDGPRRVGGRRPQPERNLVHTIVLNLLIWLQAWICWAAPYMLFFISEAVRLEREHKLMQTLLHAATAALNTLRSMGDGAAGQVAGGVFRYTTKGFEGALKEFADPEMRNRAQHPRLRKGS